MAEEQQFNQLLENLMSLDNTTRQQAETTYGTVPVDTKIVFLVKSMRNPTLDINVRLIFNPNKQTKKES
jgi:hypothetical protein